MMDQKVLYSDYCHNKVSHVISKCNKNHKFTENIYSIIFMQVFNVCWLGCISQQKHCKS